MVNVRSTIIVSGIILALSGLGCAKKEEKAPEVVRPVKTIKVAGFRQGEFTFPARVEAGKKMMVSFRVPGRILELPVKEGQLMKKGDLIAKLDPKDYRIAVEEAKATFTQTEADFLRYQTLYEKNAVPLADLDLRRAQRDVAQAKLDDARKNLSYTNLRASFAGTIGQRYVENFMDVKAQEKIVDLNDTTTVEIKIDASENLIAGIKTLGEKVETAAFAEFEAAPGKRYELKIKELAARADPATQTFEITFDMAQPDDLKLLPGMTGTVRITVRIKKGVEVDLPISVPVGAVLGDAEGGKFVWIVNPQEMTVHKQPIKAGRMRGSSELEIVEGLAGGETVVTAGLLKLREGMKVRIWEQQDK